MFSRIHKTKGDAIRFISCYTDRPKLTFNELKTRLLLSYPSYKHTEFNRHQLIKIAIVSIVRNFLRFSPLRLFATSIRERRYVRLCIYLYISTNCLGKPYTVFTFQHNPNAAKQICLVFVARVHEHCSVIKVRSAFLLQPQTKVNNWKLFYESMMLPESDIIITLCR